MAMQLWTAATPNGWKVSILWEELVEAGLDLPDLEVHTVVLGRGEQFSDAFTALNPNQKIPVLVHDGRPIIESCAILQVLGETFPSPLLPAGEARREVISWLTWQAANVGPVFGNKLSYTRYMDDVPEAQKVHPLERFGREARRLTAVLDRRLEGRDYVCGAEFTIADIALYPWLRGWKWSKVDITDRPRVMAWIERVRARPGVERGLAYGAPEGEIDQWSEATKARYRKGGASMAGNDTLPEDL